MIAFYPNRVTATRFQRFGRVGENLSVAIERNGGRGGNFLQREPHSSWGRGIPRMAARATRQTREKIFRRSIEPLIRTGTKRGNNQRGFFSRADFPHIPSPLPPRCIDRSIHTRGQSASLKLHRLTNPRQPPCPLVDPPLFYFHH